MNEQINKLISEEKSKEYEEGIEKGYLKCLGHSKAWEKKLRAELTRTKKVLKVLKGGLVENVEIFTSWHNDGARGKSMRMCEISNLTLMEADKILKEKILDRK